MSKYLITGGAGFIGRHLARALLAAGHEASVLDSLVEQAHPPAMDPLPPDIDFVEGDIRDRDAVRRALHGCDGVFHLAAEVGVGQSMYEIERYVGANGLGTAVLFQGLIDCPARRVVVPASMSIYGEGV